MQPQRCLAGENREDMEVMRAAMSVVDHVRFCGELVAACGWFVREKYYELAANHVGLDHPDSWLLTHRMLIARSRVNDFLSKVTK